MARSELVIGVIANANFFRFTSPWTSFHLIDTDANLKNFTDLSKPCFQICRFHLNNCAAEKLVEVSTLILMHF